MGFRFYCIYHDGFKQLAVQRSVVVRGHYHLQLTGCIFVHAIDDLDDVELYDVIHIAGGEKDKRLIDC